MVGCKIGGNRVEWEPSNNIFPHCLNSNVKNLTAQHQQKQITNSQ